MTLTVIAAVVFTAVQVGWLVQLRNTLNKPVKLHERL